MAGIEAKRSISSGTKTVLIIIGSIFAFLFLLVAIPIGAILIFIFDFSLFQEKASVSTTAYIKESNVPEGDMFARFEHYYETLIEGERGITHQIQLVDNRESYLVAGYSYKLRYKEGKRGNEITKAARVSEEDGIRFRLYEAALDSNDDGQLRVVKGPLILTEETTEGYRWNGVELELHRDYMLKAAIISNEQGFYVEIGDEPGYYFHVLYNAGSLEPNPLTLNFDITDGMLYGHDDDYFLIFSEHDQMRQLIHEMQVELQ
ncbi:hypothetical protein [Paenibacillus soyae]|uniref:Uncharacterized protein n=1 Tax=Paenibacillus soyae TaxID=2969249 RepID=A0A9X2MRE6_9BACL|nr:hypothetical protein [Paenibacillus soyae]MCR2806908.1 hypothetical protein [Paenibacillus soyae]